MRFLVIIGFGVVVGIINPGGRETRRGRRGR